MVQNLGPFKEIFSVGDPEKFHEESAMQSEEKYLEQ